MSNYENYFTSNIIDASCCTSGAMLEVKSAATSLEQLWRNGGDLSAGANNINAPRNPMQQVAWVYACIKALCRNAGRIPICLSHGEAAGTRAVFGIKNIRCGKIKDRKKNTGSYTKAAEGEIVQDHPLIELLSKPNEAQDWRAFCETTIGLMYSCGRVHWLFDEMEGCRPKSMWAIPGTATEPIYREGRIKKLAGWRITGSDGVQYDVPLNEIITLQLNDPENAFEGLSPLVPAKLASAIYYNADLHTASSFANGCDPGGVLETDGNIGERQAELLRSTFEQRHAGAANARKVAVLTGGLKWKSIAQTMADMQAAELARMKREDICACFGVPASVAGFLGTTGDSSAYTDNELKKFWSDTMAPLLDNIVSVIQEFLLPLYGKDYSGSLDVWADFEQSPVLQEMRIALLEAVEKMQKMGVPLADSIDWCDLGLPEREHYDIAWMPTGMIPVDAYTGGSSEADDDDNKAVTNSGTENTANKTKEAKVTPKLTDTQVSGIWRAWLQSWQPISAQLSAMFISNIEAQGRAVKKALRAALPTEATAAGVAGAAGVNTKNTEHIIASILFDVFDNADEVKKFKARITRPVESAAELGIAQGVDEAALEPAAAEKLRLELPADPRIRSAIDDQCLRFSESINSSTRNRMRRTLREGMDAGESLHQLTDRVSELVEGSRARAQGIANNAVAEAMSHSAHEGRKAAGLTHEVWLYSRGGGERRETHMAAETVYAANPKPINEKFVVNGVSMAYPRDPSAPVSERANCQCIAVGKRVSEAAANGEQIKFRSLE